MSKLYLELGHKELGMSTAVVPQHDEKRSFTIEAEIPAHPPRDQYDNSVYRAARKKLIDDDGRGCFICGRTEADLKNDDGYGRYLETHHFFVEWSLWNAIDKDYLRALRDSPFGDIYGYSAQHRGEPIKHPGEIWNLMVLCPRHHRYSFEPVKGFGIHNGLYEFWIAQKTKQDDYQLLSDDLSGTPASA